MVKPLCRSVFNKRGGSPSAWKDPPPVRDLLDLLSLPLRTSAAPSERFRECCKSARFLKISVSESDSSEGRSSCAAGVEREVEGLEEEVEEEREGFLEREEDEEGFLDLDLFEPRRADAISM